MSKKLEVPNGIGQIPHSLLERLKRQPQSLPEPVREDMAVVVVPAQRWHHFDALRGMLMMLGIVIHAAYIYSPPGTWLVHDPDGTPFFERLSYVIHLFRLPCFFMISGFLCAVVLQQKGWRHLLSSRTQRLAVPFVTAALVLNSMQAWLLAWHSGRSFWDFYSGAGWISHLWFLLDLLIYIYVLVLAWPLLSRLPSQRLPIAGGAIVLLLPLVSLVLPAVASRILHVHAPIGGFFDFHEMVYYGTFFAFGVTYQPGRDERRDRLFITWAVLLPILAMIVRSFRHGQAVDNYFEASLSWTCALALLWAGKIVFDRPSLRIRALAEDSYTVYLFHHLAVIAGGIALMSVPISIWVKYPIVVICTMIATVALHRHVIRRVRWLHFLFNGTY